jgi:hypothetical protein
MPGLRFEGRQGQEADDVRSVGLWRRASARLARRRETVVDFQSVLDEVDRLDVEISSSQPGAETLAAVVNRIGELRREVERLKGLQQPLVPDPDSAAAGESRSKSADGLGRSLESLLTAATAKQR